MADPREVDVAQRVKAEHLSPLMRAKSKAQTGEKTNACPYGCDLRQLDDHGYCRHLVGFTNDGRFYEPMVRLNGRRIVQVQMEEDPEQPIGEDGEPILKPKLERVRENDKLVKITISSRVYRDIDGAGEKMAAKKAAEDAAKRAEQRKQLLTDMRADPEFRQELLKELTVG